MRLMPVASVHMRVVCVRAEARPCKGCALMYVGNSNSATRYVSESDQQSDNRQAGTALFATGVSVTVPAAVWYRPIRLPVSRPMRTRDWRPWPTRDTKPSLPAGAGRPVRRTPSSQINHGLAAQQKHPSIRVKALRLPAPVTSAAQGIQR